MRRINRLQILAIAAIIIVSIGCKEHLDIDPAFTKTSLFKEVTEPEPSSGGFGTGDDTEAFSSTTGSKGSFTSSGVWGDGNPNGQFEPGVLTAGVWNDLEHWDFWNNLLSNQTYYEDVNTWNLKQIKRYSFLVLDENESFVANAEISLIFNEIEVWKTKTDNKGKATLWSDLRLSNPTALIKIEGIEEVVENVKDYTKGINKVYLNRPITNKKIIDIYFAVDATGSMGDELDYLKAELNNVIEQVKQNNALIEMRFGSVFYRDEGDEYLTRKFDFTNDEASLTSFISNQSAGGGGDFPEAVHSALDVAITQNSWNENASSRIIFLLLDAPPHYTQEVISSIELNLIKAAEEGIKIIPITASGIDKATEYLMRSFAILTNGTYVFITDDSGIGNDHLEPTIGEFEVEKLNDLLVRLVGENVSGGQ